MGYTSGYDYFSICGRPKGSIWGLNIDKFRNLDNTMRDFKEILVEWEKMGI